jgi:hypothetical protein
MPLEEVIQKRLKKLKRAHPEINTERIEKELIPLKPSEELQPKILKKKKKV